MGLALVEKLVEQGWNVTVLDTDRKAGEETTKRLGAQILFLETNVADYDQQSRAFVATWKKWGRLDLGELLLLT